MARFIRMLIHSLVNRAVFFILLRRIVNFGDFRKKILKHAGLSGKETILDVGCGAGEYSRLTSNSYLGMDMNADYIRYAASVYGDGHHAFRQGDLTRETFDKKFDIGLYVSMLHHFSDADNERILSGLARVVKRVVVVDPLDSPHPFRHFLVRMDRGGFIRTREQQNALLSRVFQMEKTAAFRTNSGSAELSLFVCVPKRK